MVSPTDSRGANGERGGYGHDTVPAAFFDIAEADEFRQGFLGFAVDGYGRLGLELMPWNTLEIGVTDPFGNRIRFCQGGEGVRLVEAWCG